MIETLVTMSIAFIIVVAIAGFVAMRKALAPIATPAPAEYFDYSTGKRVTVAEYVLVNGRARTEAFAGNRPPGR